MSAAGGSTMVRYEEDSSMPNKVKPAPLYQIDFTAVASGKHVAASKRRVRWRFGFANREALEAGQTGIACRGEEHDVTFVWSITSGKRLLLADGHEVHYSMVRSQTFEFSWTMKGNHVLKVVAHAAPPAQRIPGFRQYDFFVDGKSFFTMPKVYRLGMLPENANSNHSRPPNDPLPPAHRSPSYNNYSLSDGDRAAAVATPIAALETPHNAEEERAFLEEAIKNSLKESHSVVSNHKAPAPPTVEDLLLDFGEDTIMVQQPPLPVGGYEQHEVRKVAAVAPVTISNPFDSDFYHGQSTSTLQGPVTTTSSGHYHSGYPDGAALTTPVLAANSPFGFDSGYYQGQSSSSLVQPSPSSSFAPETDGFSAAPSSRTLIAPTPFAAVSNMGTAHFGFQSNYYEAQQQSSPAVEAHHHPALPSDGPFSTDPAGIASSFQLNMVPGTAASSSKPSYLNSTTTQQQQHQQQGGSNRFISGRSADEAYQNLMSTGFSITSGKSQQQEKNPFDFAEYSQNTQTTLGQMQAVKKNETKKEIMKSSVPANSGAMTISSNQQGNWGGYVNGAQLQVSASGTVPVSANPQGSWGGYMNGSHTYGGYAAPQQMQYQHQQPSQFQQQQQPSPQYSHYQQMQYPQYSSGQQQPPMQHNQFQHGY